MRLQLERAVFGVHAVQQRPQNARDQHPGFSGTGAGFNRHAAPRIAGDFVEGFGADQVAVVFVGGLTVHVFYFLAQTAVASSQKSLRHKPRAAQKSQAEPSPKAAMSAPLAMRFMSALMLSSN